MSSLLELEKDLLLAIEGEVADQHPRLLLDRVTSVDNSLPLLAGAFLGLMQAYDRGIKRDEFLYMLNDALWLFDAIARVRFIVATRKLLKDDALNGEQLDGSLQWLTTRAESRRQKLSERVALVAQIPPKSTVRH